MELGRDQRVRAAHFAHEEWLRRQLPDAPYDAALAEQLSDYGVHHLDVSATAEQNADFHRLYEEELAKLGAPPG